MNWSWITTGPGIGFSKDTLAGISAFLVGNRMIVPTAEKMSELSLEIQSSDNPATTEQQAQFDKWQKEMGQAEKLDFVLIAIAILTMAIARYWSF